MAANDIFSKNSANNSLILMKNRCFFDEKSSFLASNIGLGAIQSHLRPEDESLYDRSQVTLPP